MDDKTSIAVSGLQLGLIGACENVHAILVWNNKKQVAQWLRSEQNMENNRMS
jgi:hypothetical protein